jgi:hypothetical protein
LKISKRKFRLALLILGGLLLVYSIGYVFCRRSSIIVHAAACAANQYSSHDVVAGDAKIVSLNSGWAAFYTPLRYLEILYWRLAKPIGSSCP